MNLNEKLFGLTMPCPHCGGTGRVGDPRKVGQAMRQKRENAGVSLRKLAEVMQLSAAYISDLELGRRSWGGAIIERYSESLGSINKSPGL